VEQHELARSLQEDDTTRQQRRLTSAQQPGTFKQPLAKYKSTMDYEGQKLCENLFYWIIIIFGAIGWVYGYMEQDFVHVFYAWSVGMVISVIVSVCVCVCV